MRCSGSPTTCTAPEPREQRVALATFEALIFAEALKPLAAGAGPLGEIALTSLAEKIFIRER